jgi:Protein of unknown function (DUF4012)
VTAIKRAVAATVAVALCVTVTAVLLLVWGLRLLQAGERALEQQRLPAAAADFAKARRRLSVASALLDPFAFTLDWLPPTRNNLGNAERLAGGSADLAQAGGDVAAAAGRARREGLTSEAVLAALGRTADLVASANTDVRAASPGRFTAPPLADAKRRIAAVARPLADRARVVAALGALLGARGAYLLVVQNPAELRATGGLVGAWGIIATRQGRVRLTRLGTDLDLPAPRQPVAVPGQFAARYGRFGASRLWANANMSADFLTSARLLLGLYRSARGTSLDGVVAIDPVALSYLLEVLGPVRVRGVELRAGRFVSQSLVEAYRLPREQRGQLLVAGAEAGWRAFGDGRRLLEITQALATAAAEGHLLAYAKVPRLERQIAEAGFAGAIARPPGDYLLVVRQNAAANKLDYYLSTRLVYEVRVHGDGSATARLTIALTNNAPRAGLPDYVTGGPLTGKPIGFARSWVSVYAPERGGVVRFSGTQGRTVESAVEDGHAVYSWFEGVAPGRTVRVRLWSRLPRAVDDKHRYTLLVQRQPMLSPALLVVRVNGRQLFVGPLFHDETFAAPSGATAGDGDHFASQDDHAGSSR